MALFGVKNALFWSEMHHMLYQSGPENDPPSGQTGTYRKTEGIQSYLRTCESYDLIESGPSEPKNWDYMGVA